MDREFDAASDVELILVDDALVRSDDSSGVSLFFAQVCVSIWKVGGKAGGMAEVFLSALRTHKRRPTHMYVERLA
jgi:hypothetical protein